MNKLPIVNDAYFLTVHSELLPDIRKFFENKPNKPHGFMLDVWAWDENDPDGSPTSCSADLKDEAHIDVSRLPRLMREPLIERLPTEVISAIPDDMLLTKMRMVFGILLSRPNDNVTEYEVFSGELGELPRALVIGRDVLATANLTMVSGSEDAPPYEDTLEVSRQAALLEGVDPSSFEVEVDALEVTVFKTLRSQYRLVEGGELDSLREYLAAGALLECACSIDTMYEGCE